MGFIIARIWVFMIVAAIVGFVVTWREVDKVVEAQDEEQPQ